MVEHYVANVEGSVQICHSAPRKDLNVKEIFKPGNVLKWTGASLSGGDITITTVKVIIVHEDGRTFRGRAKGQKVNSTFNCNQFWVLEKNGLQRAIEKAKEV